MSTGGNQPTPPKVGHTPLMLAESRIFVGGRYWQAQRRQRYEEMLRAATRYSGATRDTITAFDSKTDRWIVEMKEEPIEVIVQKLTDAAEYIEPVFNIGSGVTAIFSGEERKYCV
jgi:hypothetical protein